METWTVERTSIRIPRGEVSHKVQGGKFAGTISAAKRGKGGYTTASCGNGRSLLIGRSCQKLYWKA